MNEFIVLSAALAFAVFFVMSASSVAVYGQLKTVQNSSSSSSVVSVSATVGVQVSNATMKTKESMLRSSVISFLNSGPNVLKLPGNDQVDVKSMIQNKLNNDTQNVQGVEATNAVVGVEINKALRKVVSSAGDPNQLVLVTIQTTSSCKSAQTTTCDNTVVIK